MNSSTHISQTIKGFLHLGEGLHQFYNRVFLDKQLVLAIALAKLMLNDTAKMSGLIINLTKIRLYAIFLGKWLNLGRVVAIIRLKS
ncbi:hypothetical protein [uncultured Nostoc sp.]|uniref:hypothetical protein n=1 Tax=uncultured Nostoc sp. TaxID=340711 RepID=UPI0035CADB77